MLAAEKNITINAIVAANITVAGDTALLRQVIGNLLSNAIKFNTDKGRIDVTLGKDALKITDTGIGIAHAEQAHIFDRFYQADTSRANDGFGLGLALVKRIVDLHGWTITLASKENKGTTFTVHITA